MFDVSWSELLILGLVTLIFVGPKELPRFLNTLGRYLGVIRRQANEFRSVFEQAMREAEMDQIQKDVKAVSDGVKASLDEATRSVESVKAAVKAEPEVKPLAAPDAPAGPESEAKVLPEATEAKSPDAADAAAREPDKSTAGPA